MSSFEFYLCVPISPICCHRKYPLSVSAYISKKKGGPTRETALLVSAAAVTGTSPVTSILSAVRQVGRLKPSLRAAPATLRVAGATLGGLTLRELEALAGFGFAVLLAFDGAAVAGQETLVLDRAAQHRLVTGQRLGDAVKHRAGLARQPAALDGRDDVILARAIATTARRSTRTHPPSPLSSSMKSLNHIRAEL